MCGRRVVTAKYKHRAFLSAIVLFTCTADQTSSKTECTMLWFGQVQACY